MTKTAIMQKIRHALNTGEIARAEKTSPRADAARLIDQNLSSDALVELFAKRAIESVAAVHVLNDPGELAETIRGIVPDEPRIVVSHPDTIARRLNADLWEILGRRWRVDDVKHLDAEQWRRFPVALTAVDFAIAETGSIVLAAGNELARSASLIPEIHIALVWPDQIVPDLLDLRRSLADTYGPSPPGGITIITGPSKTADIELNVVVGVHGPGQVHMIVLP